MKGFIKLAMAIGLAGFMGFNPSIATMANSEAVSTPIARTKAWDGITQTLGGIPESVRKIEYQGSIFYLAHNVSDDDFIAVLSAGPDAVRMKPPKDNGKLYNYPVYILWNSDKSILLVHPIIFDYDNILEAVANSAAPPSSLTDLQAASGKPTPTLTGAQEYMLSVEYQDAVRKEFYRLLNEYRAANGLRELEIDLELQGYADIRADELRISFSHTRPDGSYAGSGWHNSYNHMNSRYAENAIKVGTLNTDPIDVTNHIFSRWKDSKGHNRHMLYSFDPQVKMAFGFVPRLDDKGFVTSGAIFASGY